MTMSAEESVVIADRLDAAADYIEEHGWARGSYEEPDGRVCAIGALRIQCGLLNFDLVRLDIPHDEWLRRSIELSALTHALSPIVGDRSVAEWNDRVGRDAVLSALREAAQKTRVA